MGQARSTCWSWSEGCRGPARGLGREDHTPVWVSQDIPFAPRDDVVVPLPSGGQAEHRQRPPTAEQRHENRRSVAGSSRRGRDRSDPRGMKGWVCAVRSARLGLRGSGVRRSRSSGGISGECGRGGENRAKGGMPTKKHPGWPQPTGVFQAVDSRETLAGREPGLWQDQSPAPAPRGGGRATGSHRRTRSGTGREDQIWVRVRSGAGSE